MECNYGNSLQWKQSLLIECKIGDRVYLEPEHGYCGWYVLIRFENGLPVYEPLINEGE